MQRPGIPGLIVLLMSASLHGQEGLHLFPPVAFPGGRAPRNVVAGDVNQDGVADLVVAATFGADSAAAFLGDGKGGFSQVVACSAGPGVTALALRDLTHDGLPELAAAAADGVHVLVNLGAGTFAPMLLLPVGPVSDVEFADMNGDGQADVVHGSAFGSYGGTFLDGLRPDGGFSVYFGPSGPGLASLAVADVDADGDEDLLVSSHENDLVRIVYAPLSSKPVAQVVVGDGPRAVLCADVDGDDALDILTVDDESPGLTVAHAQAGGYALQEFFPLPAEPTDLEYGDLDGDGLEDVLTVASGSVEGAAVWVFAGLPAGGLAAPVPVPLGGHGAGRMATCDLNADDRLDFAVSLELEHALVVVLNAATWWNHGFGHAPAGQPVPSLVGSGTLQPEAEATLSLTAAAPATPVLLVMGLSRIFQPWQGGVLVPAPDLMLTGLATDAFGTLNMVGRWPPMLPAGAQLTFQFWLDSPDGSAASNAVSAKQP